MRYFILVLAGVLASGTAWAESRYENDINNIKQWQEAADRQKQSARYKLNGTTLTVTVPEGHGGSGDTSPFIYDGTPGVIITTCNAIVQIPVEGGIKAYTLDEFVETGRYCKLKGKHTWMATLLYSDSNYYPDVGRVVSYVCAFCHKDRKKIKKSKQFYDWED